VEEHLLVQADAEPVALDDRIEAVVTERLYGCFELGTGSYYSGLMKVTREAAPQLALQDALHRLVLIMRKLAIKGYIARTGLTVWNRLTVSRWLAMTAKSQS
jgi:hypothetical protein